MTLPGVDRVSLQLDEKVEQADEVPAKNQLKGVAEHPADSVIVDPTTGLALDTLS